MTIPSSKSKGLSNAFILALLGFTLAGPASRASDQASGTNNGAENAESATRKSPARTILVGGGIYPKKAISKFVDWAGGAKSKILVITWGGGTGGEQWRFEKLRKELDGAGAKNIEMSPTADEMSRGKSQTKFLGQLDSATGLFFTGGDQENIMDCVEACKLQDKIRRKHDEGVVFGGNSAGTAVMAASMTLPSRFGDDFKSVNPDWIDFRPGLGMIKTGIIDQHFLQRRRQSRMFAALIKSDLEWAIGVDEGNAVAIENETSATVFGEGAVWLVSKSRDDASRFTVTFMTEDQGSQDLGRIIGGK